MTEPILITEDTERRSRERLMVFAGVGVGLLVLVFLATTVLFGGGDDGGGTIDEANLPRTTRTTAPPQGGVTAGEPRETFEVFSSKNPFEPPPGAGGGTGGGGGGTATTVPGGGGGGGSTTTTTPSGNGTEPRPQQRVALLDLFTDGGARMASVRVNDTVYTVGEGDEFASSYQVVSLGAECGEFLFGDSSFTLCLGDEIVK